MGHYFLETRYIWMMIKYEIYWKIKLRLIKVRTDTNPIFFSLMSDPGIICTRIRNPSKKVNSHKSFRFQIRYSFCDVGTNYLFVGYWCKTLSFQIIEITRKRNNLNENERKKEAIKEKDEARETNRGKTNSERKRQKREIAWKKRKRKKN